MARRRQFYREHREAEPAGREDAGYWVPVSEARGVRGMEEGVRREVVEARGREAQGYEEEVVGAE